VGGDEAAVGDGYGQKGTRSKMNTERFSRRDFIKASAGGAMAAGILPMTGCLHPGERSARRPNVVILFIDDLGYGDLGCFGNERAPTPHMDSLADNGVKCTMSYVTNPPCSPSRCSLMTGMYAQRFGKSGMAPAVPIPADHPTMGEFMRDAGYVTGHIGKWHIGSTGQGPHQRGFTQVARSAPGNRYEVTREDGSPAYRTDMDGDYMAEFVEKNRDKPFFLYFSPLAIHSPLSQTPQHYVDRVKDGTTYHGILASVDDAVGKLLAALKKHDLEKDTLILLTGDNGPNLVSGGGGSSAPYRGGKDWGNTIYEGWVHTPTIATWPGTLPAGASFDGKMCTMDFYATAAAVAGKPLPGRCEGRNLLPYLKGEQAGDVHEWLFWHNDDPTDRAHRHIYAARWQDWRLIRYKDKSWRLFDLKKDPREETNVAADHPELVARMRKRYDEFVASLPPIKQGADYSGNAKVPPGWGWLTSDGRMPPDPAPTTAE